MYKVEKKDGSLQDFDRNKVVLAVIKSGGTKEEAEKVAVEVDLWLQTAAVNGVIKSTDLRTKGLEVLRNVNPTIASNYESYRKP